MSRVPESPLLLKVEDAAELLNISPTLVWRLVWSGQLPHVRISRLVRIPRKALEEWIERNQQAEPTFQVPEAAIGGAGRAD